MTKKMIAFTMSAVISLSGVASLGNAASAAEQPVNISIAASKASGWKTIDGNKYCYGKDGKPLTGWKKISGDTYYFGKDGVMRTAWVKLSGSIYYFGKDGKMRTGKVSINGKTYNFGSDGKLSSGKSKPQTSTTKTSSSKSSSGEGSKKTKASNAVKYIPAMPEPSAYGFKGGKSTSGKITTITYEKKKSGEIYSETYYEPKGNYKGVEHPKQGWYTDSKLEKSAITERRDIEDWINDAVYDAKDFIYDLDRAGYKIVDLEQDTKGSGINTKSVVRCKLYYDDQYVANFESRVKSSYHNKGIHYLKYVYEGIVQYEYQHYYDTYDVGITYVFTYNNSKYTMV
ncbi:MAG: hypothetical protein IKR73_00545 [Oscillospiraceae bacterium]|nr:hypothetical protein [Oscillospiraceae bacterium]